MPIIHNFSLVTHSLAVFGYKVGLLNDFVSLLSIVDRRYSVTQWPQLWLIKISQIEFYGFLI